MSQTASPGPPDISIIVVNYRSADLTLKALADAERSVAGRGIAVEEIVVDNASGASEADGLRAGRPGATVIELAENRGFAAGNNAGIAVARGRTLLLLNPDAFAEGDALAQLLAYLDAHPAAGVVAPLLHNADGSIQDNLYRRFPDLLTLAIDFCAPLAFLIGGGALDPRHLPRTQLDRPRRVAHVVGAVFLVRADAAADAGPLDERFFLFLEETEWQRRIAGAGWEIHGLPQASFVHLGGGSTGGFAFTSPHYLDSILRYHRHPRLALAVVTACGAISAASLRLAVALGLGSPHLRRLRDAFVTLGAELRRRRSRAA